MTSGGVRVERNGPVTTVIMNRPEARNAVNGAAAAELYEAFNEFDKDDSAKMARIDPFFRQLVADAKAQGYGEYRTHLDYMDLVAETYDWGGGALRKLNEKVKNALDPNGILAPGKSGIWPTAYAKERKA